MNANGGYWLDNWMNEYEILSIADYRRAVQSPTVLKALYEIIPFHSAETKVNLDLGSYSAMAGRSLDLSGSYHPQCFTCFQRELGILIGRSAHYFQRVAVSGPVPERVVHGLASGGNERRRTIQELQVHVSLLLYINKIGARDIITFVAKPSGYCDDCYRNSAQAAGIDLVVDTEIRQEIIQRIVETSKFRIMRNRAGEWTGAASGPMITADQWNNEWSNTFGRAKPTRKRIATGIFENMTKPVVQDFLAAKQYSIPVVDANPFSWIDREPDSSRPGGPADVALRINLPTLTGASAEDLVRIQKENGESYVKFQAAVREAVREAVKRYDSESSSRIAQAVVEEFIRPEIADIELKLKSAARSLARKGGASVVVGATATAIGLLAALPIAFTATVGSAIASLTQLYKYIDDKTSVESSDMYFLWKVGNVKHEISDV